jgi:taurine dioxygenase
MSVNLTPLTSSVGARVDGVDLTKPIDGALAATIRQALAKYSVLIFRGQDLDDDSQSAVARIFGPLTGSTTRKMFGFIDPVRMIEREIYTTVGEYAVPYEPARTDEYKGWHVDDMWAPEIPAVATLRPLTLSSAGGDTTWASMGAAFEALSPAMQAWLETLTAIHTPVSGFRATVGFYELPKEEQRRFNEEKAVGRHPLVIRHPITGRKSLYLSPNNTAAIEGLTGRESANLLRFLYSEAVRFSVTYRHCWEMGDLAIWDELATMHKGPDSIAPERKLVRIYAGLATPTAARSAPNASREPVSA